MESIGAIALFGATSGIARAVADRLASEGESLILIGRDGPALEAMAADLESRPGKNQGRGKISAPGQRPPCLVWDALDHAGHAARFQALLELCDKSGQTLQGVFLASGVQFLQDECERDPEKTRLTFETNLTGPAIILDLFAGHFRQAGSGFISAVSSVAGDRGRGKVLAYGASKAGLSAYLAGLGHRLAGTGVWVQTIKPGFVRTRLTAGMRSALMAEPERVARDIVTALRRRQAVVYTPWFWKWIMRIIRCIPAPIFRRMKF